MEPTNAEIVIGCVIAVSILTSIVLYLCSNICDRIRRKMQYKTIEKRYSYSDTNVNLDVSNWGRD